MEPEGLSRSFRSGSGTHGRKEQTQSGRQGGAAWWLQPVGCMEASCGVRVANLHLRPCLQGLGCNLLTAPSLPGPDFSYI